MKEKARSFAAGALVGGLLAASAGVVAQSKIPEETIRQLRKLTEAWGTVKKYYISEPADSKMMEGCLAGLMRSLDGNSDYVDAAAFREMKAGPTAVRASIGIEIAPVADRVRVVAPTEGGPADRAGVLPGDIIVKVDDVDTSVMALGDVARLLRGEPASRIRLSLVRQGSAAAIEVSMLRERIRLLGVRSRLVAPGVGYVRISQFGENAVDEFHGALRALAAENRTPLRGLVLDLRGNPGGLLYSGIAVAGAFLQEGQLVLSTEGRSEEGGRKYTASSRELHRYASPEFRASLPEGTQTMSLVVLIDRGSAAASEIVAGALQDHGRATVVGEKSFGRGSIQTIAPLSDDSAIKMTTAYWHLPKGRMIHGQGVAPDVPLDASLMKPAPASSFGAPGDAVLQRALQILARS